MYRYTVPIVNREPVDYPAFWYNGLEGNSQAHLQIRGYKSHSLVNSHFRTWWTIRITQLAVGASLDQTDMSEVLLIHQYQMEDGHWVQPDTPCCGTLELASTHILPCERKIRFYKQKVKKILLKVCKSISPLIKNLVLFSSGLQAGSQLGLEGSSGDGQERVLQQQSHVMATRWQNW